MALPTEAELVDEFAEYVNTPKASNKHVERSVKKATAYIHRVAGTVVDDVLTVPMPDETYTEEVMELAADLFWRRQAQHGIVNVDQMTGQAVRVARDPYAAADVRLHRWLGPGIA